VTPTGASLIKALTKSFGQPPAFTPTSLGGSPLPCHPFPQAEELKLTGWARAGVGAGTKDFPGHANVVRVVIGESAPPRSAPVPHAAAPPLPAESETERIDGEAAVSTADGAGGDRDLASSAGRGVVAWEAPELVEVRELREVEANLDDMTAETAGYAMEALLAQGALDVWYTPCTMKKSRPGTTLHVLAEPARVQDLLRTVFRETPTLGARVRVVDRVALPRRAFVISTMYGDIRCKVKLGLGAGAEARRESDTSM
jgi:pyridinium-3,5-bisthiocarboxylic acid mononucleotide nickel chelatase